MFRPGCGRRRQRGLPIAEAVSHLAPGQATVLVAEVSSFQLEFTREFRPDVSCWLNFAPDHLDWHPDLARLRQGQGQDMVPAGRR